MFDVPNGSIQIYLSLRLSFIFFLDALANVSPTHIQVNFSYFEAGENKQALVKLVACEG